MGEKTTPAEAHAMSEEIARAVRAKFASRLMQKIADETLPDMKIREVGAMQDHLESVVVQAVFPFLDGGVLPEWMSPKEPKV